MLNLTIVPEFPYLNVRSSKRICLLSFSIEYIETYFVGYQTDQPFDLPYTKQEDLVTIESNSFTKTILRCVRHTYKKSR